MKQLEQLIITGEGYQLEFKENIDKSLAKEICGSGIILRLLYY